MNFQNPKKHLYNPKTILLLQTQDVKMPTPPACLMDQKMLDDYNNRAEKPQAPQEIDPKQHQHNQACVSYFLL